MQHKPFQVDLTGIIKILSDHLYSQKEVFIRELLQNAVDAISARQQLEAFDPEILIEYFEHPEGNGFIISDNGIGLTHEEVETFLAKVGSSSKSRAAMEKTRSDFIGQFGIGILSCFMVADNITVMTKSRKGGDPLKWEANIQGTYKTEVVEDSYLEGTKVILKFRKDTKLSAQRIQKYIKRFGAQLDIPIQLELNGREEGQINKRFPWEGKPDSSQCLAKGEEIFKEKFSHYFLLPDTEKGGYKGVVYFLSRPSHAVHQQEGLLYVKRMFVTKNMKDVLPQWASFVRIILNTDELSLNASRESVYADEKAEVLQEELQHAIIGYFNKMSQQTPKALERLIELHGLAIKQMALAHPEFLSFIYRWFTFYTPEGKLSLEAIKKRKNSVLYIADLDEYRQISPIAKANDILLINAGYVYDAELMEEIVRIDQENEYVRIDAEYFGDYLGEVKLEDYDRYSDRVAALQRHLEKYNCLIELREFEPPSIQAIYHSSADIQLSEDILNIRKESDDLWGAISENVFEAQQNKPKLFLNFKNKVVGALLDQPNPMDKEIIETLLFNAMLLGHYPLEARALETMNKNFGLLLQLAFKGE